jgi:hypothetical protein
MVALKRLENENTRTRGPADIFRAAANDDVQELQRAIAEGQTLDLIEESTGFNPVIVALLERSEQFLLAAMKIDFDPWHRDPNERLAIDHANALGMREIQRLLLQKMYPPGWSEQLPKEPMP